MLSAANASLPALPCTAAISAAGNLLIPLIRLSSVLNAAILSTTAISLSNFYWEETFLERGFPPRTFSKGLQQKNPPDTVACQFRQELVYHIRGILFWKIRESSPNAARTLSIVRNGIVSYVDNSVIRGTVYFQVGKDVE